MTTSSSNSIRRVCLFGTSANPPTGNQGHAGIVRALAGLQLSDNTTSNTASWRQVYDEIRVVPVYSHPFAAKRKKLAPFEHRLNMCQLAFQDIPRVVLSQAEYHIYQEKLAKQQQQTTDRDEPPAISIGTADLLEYYHATDQTTAVATPTEYTLCLGADTFLDLTGGKWRRTQELLDMIQGRFVVLYRRDNNTNTGNGEQQQQTQLKQAIAKLEETYGKGSIRLLEIPSLGAVSSTMVRKLSREMSQGSSKEDVTGKDGKTQDIPEQQMNQMVNTRVLEYMKKHELYGFHQNDVDNYN